MNIVRFCFKKRLLAFNAPAVPRQRAVTTYDPMARNGDRNRIGSTRSRYSPRGAWGADTGGKLSIGGG